MAKRIAVLEREINQLEMQLADLDSRINHNAADPEKLMGLLAEKDEIDGTLLEKMEEWEQLSEALGNETGN
jgi:ATP-binding cassette subfamily F protein uup